MLLIKVTSYRDKPNESSSYKCTKLLNLLPTATVKLRITLLVYCGLDMS